jgi:Flp pilus assembly protein TadG
MTARVVIGAAREGEPRSRRPPSDRGSVATEMVLLTPVLVLLLLFIAYAGRSGVAVEQVRHAADQGARAASLVRSSAMSSAASSAVLADLRANGVSCGSPTVSTTTGTSGGLRTVTVVVSCTVARSGLSLLGVDIRTVSARSTEVIDRYRSGA